VPGYHGISAIQKVYDRVVLEGKCLIWPGNKLPRGYGMVRDGKSMRTTHSVVFEHEHGPVPKSLEIDHLCSNPGCVNLEHLEAVSRQENMRRAVARRTHCRSGRHEITPENTYSRHGRRGQCRPCALESRRKK
jgi:hypothetical protein